MTAMRGFSISALDSCFRIDYPTHHTLSERGRSGIGRITRFDPAQYPAKLAGEVANYDVREHVSGRLVPQTDQATRLALIATDAAISDSGLELAVIPGDQMTTTATARGAGAAQRRSGRSTTRD